MNPILNQAFIYFIVLICGIFLISMFQRGFFWTYAKVRLSFGKYILVKIRSLNREYFTKGEIIEGFLILKDASKEMKRISIRDSNFSYRCMAVQWVDVDEEKNCITKKDYETETGFDAVKYQELYKRALYKPQIQELDKMQKIVIVLILIGIILGGVGIYMNVRTMKETQQIRGQVGGLDSRISLFLQPSQQINPMPTPAG